MALMPIFAKEVLHSDAFGFGALMSAPGIGAVIGTLTVASQRNVERKGHLLLATLIIVGASLILFSMSRNFVLSFMLLVVNGGAQMVFMTTNQTLLQLTIPEELRGRVMGIYLLNQGLMPLGSLFAGTLASFLGAPTAVTIMGASVMVLAAAFVLRSDNIRNA
jgi:predicted MFS family arabinose efflux permease